MEYQILFPYFLILALGLIPTSATFLAYSAGSIIFISLGGLLLYKERFTLINKLAIFLVIIALILIKLCFKKLLKT